MTGTTIVGLLFMNYAGNKDESSHAELLILQCWVCEQIIRRREMISEEKLTYKKREHLGLEE